MQLLLETLNDSGLFYKLTVCEEDTSYKVYFYWLSRNKIKYVLELGN